MILTGEKRAYLFLFFLGFLFLILAFIPGFFLNNYEKINNTFSLGKRAFILIWAIFISLAYLMLLKNLDKAKIFQSLKVIIFFYVVISLILILIPPVGSGDIYGYFFQARIFTHYHLNPYLHPPQEFFHDMFFNYSLKAWNSFSYVYGPLWLVLTSFFSKLTSGRITSDIYIFRFFLWLVNIFSIWLVYKIAEKIKPERKFFTAALFAFNPLLLFEGLNNGHADIIMVFFVLLSLYLFLKNRNILSVSVLLLAILTKLFPAVFLPVLLFFIIKKKNSRPDRIIFSLKLILMSIFIFFLFLWPFPPASAVYQSLKDHILFGRFTLSVVPFLIFNSLDIMRLLIGGGIFSLNQIISITKIISGLAFLILYLRIFIKAKKFGINDLMKTMFLVWFYYIILAGFYSHPWYVILFLPFAVFLPKQASLKVIFIILLVWALAYYCAFSLASLSAIIIAAVYKGFIKPNFRLDLKIISNNTDA